MISKRKNDGVLGVLIVVIIAFVIGIVIGALMK